MQLARVVGHATSTIKHPSLHGVRLMLCETADERGQGKGDFFLASDWLGVGLGAFVIVNMDGDYAERFHKDPTSPLRNTIYSLVDMVEGGAA
jgi:ethanolamine utilization protein EutN